ncbi:MAG: hypothetical protein J0L66_06215 [Cytophagales bacterium]|nr:hypothetical protein [Cytophagales bacterium]
MSSWIYGQQSFDFDAEVGGKELMLKNFTGSNLIIETKTSPGTFVAVLEYRSSGTNPIKIINSETININTTGLDSVCVVQKDIFLLIFKRTQIFTKVESPDLVAPYIKKRKSRRKTSTTRVRVESGTATSTTSTTVTST